VTKYPIRSFLIVTFLISSAIFSLYQFIPTVWFTLYFAVAMWVPGLVAIWIRRAQGIKVQPSLLLVWKSNRYVWLSAFTPMVLIFVLIALNILFTNATFKINEQVVTAFNDLGVPANLHVVLLIGQTMINGFIAGISINAIFALGEEIGWRGFLQKEFDLGLWKSGLLIGAIWGLWHAPLVIQGYNFPQNPMLGVLMMIVACAPLGLIMSYFVQRSGSVISAAFFHGVFNAVAGLGLLVLDTYVDYIHNPFGITAIIVYSSLALFLYFLERRRQLNIVV
jgi:membrane protease YdiL (CAAX protease family)